MAGDKEHCGVSLPEGRVPHAEFEHKYLHKAPKQCMAGCWLVSFVLGSCRLALLVQYFALFGRSTYGFSCITNTVVREISLIASYYAIFPGCVC